MCQFIEKWHFQCGATDRFVDIHDKHFSPPQLLPLRHLRELGHGLGFSVNPTDGLTGSRASGLPSIWEQNMLDTSSGKLWSDMGFVEQRLGKIDEARPLFEKSIRILERSLGPDHHELAWPCLGLASNLTLRSPGNYYETGSRLTSTWPGKADTWKLGSAASPWRLCICLRAPPAT